MEVLLIICAAATAIVFISSGTLFAVGVFQELYQSMATEPDNPFTNATPAQISLIGALAGSFMYIGAPFVTAWTRQFSPRVIVASGGFSFGLASVLASFGTSLWHFQLSQGLLFGLGICNAFIPAITVTPTWYTKRRALATGIISSGTGIGGLVWAPVIQALIDRVGYRNALRISGVITGTALIALSFAIEWDPATMVRIRKAKDNETRSWHRQLWNIHLINWDIAKTRQFAAQTLAGVAQSAAYFTPVFFISAAARTFGLSATQGANLIAISNACNAISKVLAGFLADRIGRLETLMIVTALATICVYALWLPSTTIPNEDMGRSMYIAFVVGYGVFASPYVALFPAVLVDLFGRKEFAEVNGAIYLLRGLAILIGLPVAGVLVRSTATVDRPTMAYTNASLFIGALFVLTCIGNAWIWVEARRSARQAK